MLEVLYDVNDNSVIAWCADPSQFAKFQPKPGEGITILPIDPPDYESEQFFVDLANQTITGEPSPPDPDYVRVCKIVGHSPRAIPAPQVWELLRILAKKVGYECPK